MAGGSPLATSTGLAAQGTLRRRPTGISSDEQTLFVWDEVVGMERAAWIDQSTGAFDVFVDLGTRSMAAPESTCSRLYYSAPGTESIRISSWPRTDRRPPRRGKSPAPGKPPVPETQIIR